MYSQLFSKIQQDFERNNNNLWLVPTLRLARHLQSHYGQHCGELSNFASFKPLNIDTPASWLLNLWQELSFESENQSCLLSTWQQQIIMEKIIADSSLGGGLLRTQQTAAQVLQARSLLIDWQVPGDICREEKKLDIQAFYSWQDEYENYLEQTQNIDNSSIVLQILKILDNHKSLAELLPKSIVCYEFEEFTPLQNLLFKKLSSLGVKISVDNLPAFNASIAFKHFSDINNEWQSTATWAKENNNNASVLLPLGVICPDLTQVYHSFSQTFYQPFLNENIDLNGDKVNDLPINMSAGTPLAKKGVIAMAFMLLTWAFQKLTRTELGHLFSSNFWGPRINNDNIKWEWSKQAMSWPQPHWSLRDWLNIQNTFHLSAKDKENNSANLNLWQELLTNLQNIPTKKEAYPSEWANIFSLYLQHAGWPTGHKQLSSIDYQAVTQMSKLFDEFAALDRFLGPISAPTALKHLRYQANRHMFQPQSEQKTIQVLGPLEAAGLRFKKCWILGMSANQWPQSPKPNPYIPLSIAKQYGLPQSSHEREYTFSKRLTRRFMGQAEKVIFSYSPAQLGEQAELTPILAEWCQQQKDNHNYQSTFQEPVKSSIKLRLYNNGRSFWRQDDKLPEWRNKDKVVSGGGQVFKDMIVCPFTALVKRRLGLSSSFTSPLGLNAAWRGQMVHDAMEHLVYDVQQNDNLENIKGTISNTVKAWRHKPGFKLGDGFWWLESQRLESTLIRFYQLEQQRAAFDIVSREQKISLSIGDIQISMRIDRLDKVDNNYYALMDYKTGRVQVADSLTVPPLEPQMWLYALALDIPLSAMIWSQITAKKVGYLGFDWSGEKHFPGIKKQANLNNNDEYKALLVDNEKALLAIADNFCRSDYPIIPLSGEQTCRRCDMQGLCRLYDRKSQKFSQD